VNGVPADDGANFGDTHISQYESVKKMKTKSLQSIVLVYI
jgi:hypothetical protein